MADVTFTVDGKKLTAPAGTLLIEACRGRHRDPAFCYYPGCRCRPPAACASCAMEKVPKLQTACTTPVAEGMVVTTESAEIAQARKATLELLLGNHPLDCPVCDAGGECELQDMTFKYGAAESKFMRDQEPSRGAAVVAGGVLRPPALHPLLPLRARVRRRHGRLGARRAEPRRRAPSSRPTKADHLDCEECGMCIDICPVGALTSGSYRYKTRPWEMNHVATVCTHCGDGCKTTLGVRRADNGSEIVRGDNRDKSGINGDFLCIKGRYAFDFAQQPERLTKPLITRDGKFAPATWEQAFELIADQVQGDSRQRRRTSIGVIGSNRTTNEENYLLQKFARAVLGTNNIDHHRTADFPAFASALAGKAERHGFHARRCAAPAILLIGNDPTEQHPLLAWQIRTNVRLHRAKLYLVNSAPIKLRRQASAFAQIAPGAEARLRAVPGRQRLRVLEALLTDGVPA